MVASFLCPSDSGRTPDRNSGPTNYAFCVGDGLNGGLRLEVVPVERLSTTVEDRESGRRLTFTLRPEFARSITDLTRERLEAEGRRVAALPDGDVFTVVEEKAPSGE